MEARVKQAVLNHKFGVAACDEAENPSWATTATGGTDYDVDLGELEVASDTDEPKLKDSVTPSTNESAHHVDSPGRDFASTDASEPEVSLPDDKPQVAVAETEAVCRVAPHFARKMTLSVPEKPLIALVVNGSRGDVQPFLALAQGLQRRGRRAILFTNYDFLDFCTSAGVEAVATFHSWTDLKNDLGGFRCPDFPAGKKSIPTQDILEFIEGTLHDAEHHRAAQNWRTRNPGCIIDPYEALVKYEPCVVLYALQSQNPPLRYEHVHKVPAVPVYFTSAFGPHFTSSRVPRPSLFATSSALDMRLPENGLNHITGPWLLQEEFGNQEIEAIPSLAAAKHFIEAGEKPVAIGWGSMQPQGTPALAMLGLALRALKKAGRRGIILGGWARLHELGSKLLGGGLEEIGSDHEKLRAYAEEKVCFVEHVPHSWLYPRCRCIVNHGGSGTVHAALRAGCPVVVTPIYGDQFHFAHRVSKLGVGVGLQKSLRYVDEKELSRAILKASACVEQAKQVASKMKKDAGTSLAVDILEDFLTTEVGSGRFKAEASSAKQRRAG